MSIKCMGTINEGSLKGNQKKRDAIVTDPNGSYTGRPLDKSEKPVQDADDL